MTACKRILHWLRMAAILAAVVVGIPFVGVGGVCVIVVIMLIGVIGCLFGVGEENL